MIYKIIDKDIIVYDKSQFNPKHILECGQVFRYGKDQNNNYYVITKSYKATIIENKDTYTIKSNNPEYFVNYFDLNTDYQKAKNALYKFDLLKPMIDFGYGIRILKADPEEMIYSYIISQNNNIKRIQKIIENLCSIGNIAENYNTFPTSAEIAKQNSSFFKNLGAGYRDTFLQETAQTLKDVNIQDLEKLSTDNLYNYLISLKGIGPKVASCILLFGFNRTDKFPVDTWIEQVYYNHFNTEKKTRSQIQKYFESEFKEFSGIAQQYLFYFEREKNKV